MEKSDTPSLRERLRQLDTSTLSDALDALGLNGVVPGLTPYGPPTRIAGRARTVELGPATGQVADRHLCTAAIEAAQPGDVIVIAHNSRADVAGWGGLLSVAAQAGGVAGVIVDGVCRDVDDYIDLGLPVYARGAVPTSARGRVAEIATGTAIPLGPVTVRPGDWLVADRSGTVVIVQERVKQVLDTAEALSAREALMAADLRTGQRVTEVLGRTYETMLGHRTA
ncbi:RraA family protein [Streptomyces sp. NPDC057580]|uniref:RraA family protein n=1 Tax=Streptomyces sp. NPDC057580 TaxID=3346173 RepID=UPI0036C4EF61